jgi:voltage-gated potassium channel
MTQQRWQRLMEWPLAVTAIIFLVAYSWEVIGDLKGPPGDVAEGVIWATWAIFVADYIVMLVLARSRWRWFYTHLFDLLVVALPMLRPLRLLRLVTIATVLQRTVGRAFRGRVLIYVVGAASLLVYIAALAVLDAERGHGGTIRSLGDGLWWAFVTITTVGYGDKYPITLIGRATAVFVMFAGVGIIGSLASILASILVPTAAETAAAANAADDEETAAGGVADANVARILDELAAIRAELADLRAIGAAGADGPAATG